MNKIINNKNYNLEKRTLEFSKAVVVFCKKVKINLINKNIIEQLLRAVTSTGANYCEANGASSKKDFKNKISICKKEAKETRYWLIILKTAIPEKTDEINILLKESHELLLIFSKIFHSSK